MAHRDYSCICLVGVVDGIHRLGSLRASVAKLRPTDGILSGPPKVLDVTVMSLIVPF